MYVKCKTNSTSATLDGHAPLLCLSPQDAAKARAMAEIFEAAAKRRGVDPGRAHRIKQLIGLGGSRQQQSQPEDDRVFARWKSMPEVRKNQVSHTAVQEGAGVGWSEVPAESTNLARNSRTSLAKQSVGSKVKRHNEFLFSPSTSVISDIVCDSDGDASHVTSTGLHTPAGDQDSGPASSTILGAHPNPGKAAPDRTSLAHAALHKRLLEMQGGPPPVRSASNPGLAPQPASAKAAGQQAGGWTAMGDPDYTRSKSTPTLTAQARSSQSQSATPARPRPRSGNKVAVEPPISRAPPAHLPPAASPASLTPPLDIIPSANAESSEQQLPPPRPPPFLAPSAGSAQHQVASPNPSTPSAPGGLLSRIVTFFLSKPAKQEGQQPNSNGHPRPVSGPVTGSQPQVAPPEEKRTSAPGSLAAAHQQATAAAPGPAVATGNDKTIAPPAALTIPTYTPATTAPSPGTTSAAPDSNEKTVLHQLRDKLRQEREAAQAAAQRDTPLMGKAKRVMLVSAGRTPQQTQQQQQQQQQGPPSQPERQSGMQSRSGGDITASGKFRQKEALEVVTEAVASAARRRSSATGSTAPSRAPSRKASFHMTASALAEALDSPRLTLSTPRRTKTPGRRPTGLTTPPSDDSSSLPKLQSPAEAFLGDVPRGSAPAQLAGDHKAAQQLLDRLRAQRRKSEFVESAAAFRPRRSSAGETSDDE
jgi:hypothetical protein